MQTQRWGFRLTFGGAQEILPASPQQAGESGRAGGDLFLQERTNPGADLQQVVCADVPVQFHLDTQTHTQGFISAWSRETAEGERHRNSQN